MPLDKVEVFRMRMLLGIEGIQPLPCAVADQGGGAASHLRADLAVTCCHVGEEIAICHVGEKGTTVDFVGNRPFCDGQ